MFFCVSIHIYIYIYTSRLFHHFDHCGDRHDDNRHVDGYHHASQVYKDCKNAWNSLKFGGYLICDDYIWNFYKDIKENPCYAVNRFLQEISDDLIVKKISNSQIFVKKTRSKD